MNPFIYSFIRPLLINRTPSELCATEIIIIILLLMLIFILSKRMNKLIESDHVIEEEDDVDDRVAGEEDEDLKGTGLTQSPPGDVVSLAQ